jgi:dCTP deaminase
MILTGKEIKKNVENRKIHIYPFVEENVNPNSYNYRLGYDLLEINDFSIDAKKPSNKRKIDLSEEGYVLQPQRLYLASTYEEIGSDHYVTSLIGRSSIGRLGLFLQITADLGHLGAKHRWTLELKCVQPLKVYPGMKIGQVSFWSIKGDKESMYKGKYDQYSCAHLSEIYKEFLGN